MKNKVSKRILSMLLAIVMVVGLMPIMSPPASASSFMESGKTCYFTGDRVPFGEIKDNDFLQVGVIVTGAEGKSIVAGGEPTSVGVSEYDITQLYSILGVARPEYL